MRRMAPSRSRMESRRNRTILRASSKSEFYSRTSSSSSSNSSHIALSTAKAQAKPMPRIQAKYHIVSSSIGSGVAGKIARPHRPAHDAIDPACIGQDEGQEDQNRAEHDLERELARRGIPHGQTGIGLAG